MESRAKYLRIMLLLLVSISCTPMIAMIKYATKGGKNPLTIAEESKTSKVPVSEKELNKMILNMAKLVLFQFLNNVKKIPLGDLVKQTKNYINDFLKVMSKEVEGVDTRNDVLIPAFIYTLGKMITIKPFQDKDTLTKLDVIAQYIQNEYGEKITENQRKYLVGQVRTPIRNYISRGIIPVKEEVSGIEGGLEWLYGKEQVSTPSREESEEGEEERELSKSYVGIHEDAEKLGQFQTLVEKFLASGNQEVKGKLLQNVLDVSEKNPEILGKYIQRMITVAQDRLHILENYEQLEQFKDNLTDVNDDLKVLLELPPMKKLIKETGEKYEAARADQERATPPTKDLSTLLQQLQGKLTELNTQLSS